MSFIELFHFQNNLLQEESYAQYMTDQGYLNSRFQLFHILDTDQKTFEFHYHDFHKTLIFLQGDVSYIVEGKSYNLKSY